MQLQFVLESNEPFTLPLHYNHLIQGFIYEAIDPELSAFLHEKGFEIDGRSFRLFVFSRLMGRYKINKNDQSITFGNRVRLLISSPLKEFCDSMIRNIVRRGDLHLGKNILHGVEYQMIPQETNADSINVITKSPITVYSTLLRPEGKKYTAFFQPGEPDYNRLITGNLLRKYKAAFNEVMPVGDVSVTSLNQLKLTVLKYKDFIIKGYSGKLKLSGPPGLLQIALDAGLGAKNSQGFGFIQMC